MNRSEQTKNTVVEFRDVTLGYGRAVTLKNLTFTIAEGDFLGIVGPNGSGKTTILRAILGTVKPFRGSITVREGLKFGYVMQRQSLDDIFPLSVLDVVSMGRLGRVRALRRFGKDDRDKIDRALSVAGIEELKRKMYRELSGGQKQRLLVARALAFEPEVLLLDEPTNDLDIQAEEQIMNLIRDIHLSIGITIVLVSHFLNVVFNHVRRVMFLKRNEGRMYAREEALRPELLSEIYEVPILVQKVNGRTVIVPEGKNDAAFS